MNLILLKTKSKNISIQSRDLKKKFLKLIEDSNYGFFVK